MEAEEMNIIKHATFQLRMSETVGESCTEVLKWKRGTKRSDMTATWTTSSTCTRWERHHKPYGISTMQCRYEYSIRAVFLKQSQRSHQMRKDPHCQGHSWVVHDCRWIRWLLQGLNLWPSDNRAAPLTTRSPGRWRGVKSVLIVGVLLRV